MVNQETQNIFNQLSNPPQDAQKRWYQDRGRKFEKLLHNLLADEDMDPRTNYRPKGEEIDGSFVFNGSIYLLEAKWTATPIPASSLYNFKGKIDGKLVGTIGIFISMSDYSQDAIDALTKGKEINLILFGQKDIQAIIIGDASFTDVLRYKLRVAAEKGVVYIESQMREISVTSEQKLDDYQTSTAAHADSNTLAFICEGTADQMIIQTLMTKVISEYFSKAKIRILTAGGSYNLPRVANALSIESTYRKIFVITDSDGDVKGTHSFLSKSVDVDSCEILILENSIEEEWLDLDISEANKLKDKRDHDLFIKITELISNVDLLDLRKRSQNFNTIMTEIDQIPRY
jgi:hypothetical protein